MKDLPACPQGRSVLTCEDGAMLICPECGHEWTEAEPADARVTSDLRR